MSRPTAALIRFASLELIEGKELPGVVALS